MCCFHCLKVKIDNSLDTLAFSETRNLSVAKQTKTEHYIVRLKNNTSFFIKIYLTTIILINIITKFTLLVRFLLLQVIPWQYSTENSYYSSYYDKYHAEKSTYLYCGKIGFMYVITFKASWWPKILSIMKFSQGRKKSNLKNLLYVL